MGGGSKKHAEYFTVAPAIALLDPEETHSEHTAEDPLFGVELPQGLQAALEELHHVATFGQEGVQYPLTGYAQLSSAVGGAQAALAAAAADQGLDGDLVAQVDSDIKQASLAWLGSLDDTALQQLAAAHGFEHPTLVGLSGSGAHPLVHWLDPSYATDAPSKAKIQAKAGQRWAALAAGETINGLTYPKVVAAEAELGLPAPVPGGGPGTWQASPAAVSLAMASLADAVAALPPTLSDAAPKLRAVIDAENTLHTASCGELGEALGQLQGAAKHLVDQKLEAAWGLTPAMKTLAPELHEEGRLTAAEAAYLSAPQALALLRASSQAGEIEAVRAQAVARAAQVAELAQLEQAHSQHVHAGALTLPPLSGDDGAQTLALWVTATGDYFELRSQAGEWAKEALQPPAGLTNTWKHNQQCKQTTTAFRQWAKTQKLAQLRAVAASLGLADAKNATRAQVQNFIAAGWDHTLNGETIQAQIATKQPPGNKPAAKTVTSTAAKAAGSSKPTGKPPASFAGKLSTLVAKLRAHQAVAVDVPAPLPAEQVADWKWGPGKTFNAGSHASSVHDGPDGRQWMFKADKSAAGARAHAEAAASQIFRAVGVPGVGVHVAEVSGKTGAIQPLVKGATHFPSDPKSWSQADVDALVQLHVVAWAVGDHDGHAGNVLRTPSGGVMACDQGQAFKFFGRDRLGLGWKPTTNPHPPLYQQAYQAQAGGGLAPGVTVRAKAALPTIKAFEALPDQQYRTMLAETATRGVKGGLAWVEPMREQAAKRLGKTAVSDGEVAEEFLRTAVERKNSLRASFANLLGECDVADASHLKWVG